MSQDKLYKEQPVKQDFQFTAKVAEVFDDMLDRSVPCYRQIIDMTGRILSEFLKPDDLVYDLGCSTGTTLLELSRQLNHLDLRFIGVDNSSAMLKKAAIKAEMYSKQESLKFTKGNLVDIDFEQAGAIVINYTLQFIRPMQRQELLNKIYQALKPGGVLIMSEKVISSNPILNRNFIKFYLDFKREQGYSEMEISKKREALENVLVPFTTQENMKMLKNAKFSNSEPFYQWFNFVSFLAIK